MTTGQRIVYWILAAGVPVAVLAIIAGLWLAITTGEWRLLGATLAGGAYLFSLTR